MDEENNNSDSDVMRFSLSYTLDRDQFFRRECPNCSREFKTQVDEDALVSSLRPAFREAGLEFGEDAESDDKPDTIICPYCEFEAPTSEMLTQSFASYLQRYIYREYICPTIHQMFSGFSDSLNRPSRRSTGGFFSIEITSEYSRSSTPPRPISGPEAPDLTKIDMLCCGKSIKVLDGWFYLSKCPYCATPVKLQ